MSMWARGVSDHFGGRRQFLLPAAHQHLARPLQAFDEQHSEPGPGPATAALPGLVESLTAREVQVLGLLAEGKSNQRIARELVVTLDTVKRHVSHLLSKPGPGN